MISEALIGIIAGLVSAIGGMFPTMETPAFLAGLADKVAVVTGWMAPLGVWVPLNAASTATQVVLTAAAAAIAIKLLRLVVSLFTGGGGSAA